MKVLKILLVISLSWFIIPVSFLAYLLVTDEPTLKGYYEEVIKELL